MRNRRARKQQREGAQQTEQVEKRADITIVTTTLPEGEDASRFGTVLINDSGRIIEFEEKPIVTKNDKISTGIYIIRRRMLIELLERALEEERFDLVKDILIRYKGLKKILNYYSNTMVIHIKRQNLVKQHLKKSRHLNTLDN